MPIVRPNSILRIPVAVDVFPRKSGFWNALAHFIGTKDVPKVPTVHSYYPHTLGIRIAAYICKSLPQMQLVVILMITSS